MKIICIYSGVSSFEQKLDYVFSIFKNTLNEIGIDVSVLDITKADINYYNGTKQPIVENIFEYIKKSQGVIFATTAQRFAPNGAMQVFLEHLDCNLYEDILKDKTCMSIITSSDSSEYMAGNYMNMLINSLGGVSINNMLIGKEYLPNIEISEDTKQMIEKYAEDYYRMVKQSRRYFISTPFKNMNVSSKQEINVQKDSVTIEDILKQDVIKEENKPVRNLTGAQVADLYKKEIDNNINSSINNINNIALNNGYQKNAEFKNNNILQENNINNINNKIASYKTESVKNDENNDDISHIAKLLGQKFQEEVNNKNNLNNYMKNNSEVFANVSPSINSLKQKTQSLYHYFQPQLAKDIDTSIQINISGKENFNGFFVIKNGECNYTEGVNPSAEVTIISDSLVWEEVLDGKCTLQKAFMLGRLKVKGNFIIISKFEQFFKIM